MHTGEFHWEKCYHWKERISEFVVSGHMGNYTQGIVKLYPDLHMNFLEAIEPLPAEVVSSISLNVSNIPEILTCKERFTCEVEITNASDLSLFSYTPYPIHISYHWLNEEDGKIIVFDGERSKLLEPLGPHSRGTFGLTVIGPQASGKYILRITLVQEQLFWFDEVSKQAYHDEHVRII